MTALDDFVRSQVQPILEPGEQIVSLGTMNLPTYKAGADKSREQPTHIDYFFAVATHQRLVLLPTSGGLSFKPVTHGVAIVWNYDLIRSVAVENWEFRYGNTGSVFERAIVIEAHPGLVPPHFERVTYHTPAKCLTMTGQQVFDGQVQFHATFPPWLEAQVRAGAFPLTARTGPAAQAAGARALAAVGAERQRQAQIASERSAKLKAAWPLFAAGFAVLLGLCLMAFAGSVFSKTADMDRDADRLSRAMAESSHRQAASQRSVATGLLVVGLLVTAAGVGVAVWYRRRAKKRDRAAAPPLPL